MQSKSVKMFMGIVIIMIFILSMQNTVKASSFYYNAANKEYVENYINNPINKTDEDNRESRTLIFSNLIIEKKSKMLDLALKAGADKVQLTRKYQIGSQNTNLSWNDIGGSSSHSLSLRVTFRSERYSAEHSSKEALSDYGYINAPVEGYYDLKVYFGGHSDPYDYRCDYGGWSPDQYARTYAVLKAYVNDQTFASAPTPLKVHYWVYADAYLEVNVRVYLKKGNNPIRVGWVTDIGGTLPNGSFNFPFSATIGGQIRLKANYTVNESVNNGAYKPVLKTQLTNVNLFTADINAPTKPSIDLLSIKYNKDELTLKTFATDNSTNYKHYVDCDSAASSDVVSTNVITGVKGYSFVIDKETSTEPDAVIDITSSGAANGLSTGTQVIDRKYVNSGYYIHIKAIDNAGNIGPTLHQKLEYVEKAIVLTKDYTGENNINERGMVGNAGWNFVDLSWKLTETYPDKTIETDTKSRYTFYVYGRKEGETTYVSKNVGKLEEIRMQESEDILGPDRPIISMTETLEESNKINVSVYANDKSTAYEYFILAVTDRNGEETLSNTVVQEVKTGVKGFAWVIDGNANTDPGNVIKDFPTQLDKSYIGKMLHIRAIDWVGNLGECLHIKVEVGRQISLEQLNEDENLFCIQYGQDIPASQQENYLNATITAGDGEYKFVQTVEEPKTGDIIGRKFIEGRTTNIYGTKDIFSYSIARYHISKETPEKQDGKDGNASEKEAYILNEYKNNTSLESYVQNAMYTTDISDDNTRWDWSETAESQALVAEAEAYEAYREAGYNPQVYKMNTECMLSKDFSRIVIGPLKLNYEPKAIKVKGIDRPEVYFANIIGAKIYDQNGNLIGEKDKNGTNIGNVEWEFIYIKGKPGVKREDELFSYDKYKYPVGNEEFYIELKYNKHLDNVTGISKIEFTHQELIADAEYSVLEGRYNKIRWAPNIINEKNKDVLWCMQVRDEGIKPCIHGRTEPNHIVGCYFYLTATVMQKNIMSQKLLEVEWIKKYYRNSIQTLTAENASNNPEGPGAPIWKITVDFSGNVWDDGIEDANDGLKQAGEKGIDKIAVRVYRVDVNGNRLGEVYSTYTDSTGNYAIYNATRGLYDLEFEFDGQTYKTTKLLVNGEPVDYRKDYTQKKFANNSMAEETKEERQALNNNFLEIAGNNKAYGANGEISLEYEETEGKATLVTLNQNGYVKNEFKLKVRTSSNDIYYPITEVKEINGIEYIKMADVKNANLGLAHRLKTDESIKMDVYESTFSIKNIKQSFIQSEENIRERNNTKNIGEYIQYVNNADYNWKWQENYEKFGEDFKNIWSNPNECELEAYVDYMVIIRNDGEKDFVKITELVDYYDKTKYEYDLEGNNRDFDMMSWAIIKRNDVAESRGQNISSIIKVDWKESSKYNGVANPYSDSYNKMYTNSLEQLQLKKGEYIELHIIFKVKKDKDNNIYLEQTEEGKRNHIEINGYQTYYVADSSVAGLIDTDSKPGNLNPLRSTGFYENDEDKAANYKLQLDPTTINITNEDTEINKDQYGNYVGYGNVIEGSVWEDLRKNHNAEYLKMLKNNQIIGDVIRQEEEPLINNIKVELVETFENIKTGKSIERVIDTQTTRNILSITNEDKIDGNYKFTNLPSGKYRVQFTYGEEQQLQENMKYNGQDYQGISTETVYSNEELARNYENLEIIFTLDISNSMTEDKITATKEATKELVTKLSEKLTGVKIGIVNFNQEARNIVKPTNNVENIRSAIDKITVGGETSIGKGIEKTISTYSTKNVDKKIMILLTDGEETTQNNESVIRQIENASDKYGITMISALLKESNQIFGTESEPRRGKVYNLRSENVKDEIVQKIYQEVLQESIIKKDRSYGQDIPGDENNNVPGTRYYSIQQSQLINIENGTKLDVESIDKLTGTDRQNAISAFAKDTYIVATTNKVIVNANNIKVSKVEQMNLALRERPKVELYLESQIENIKITLSDGTVIIDTKKGMRQNVSGLETKELPILVYMDEEIMQGATITIEYKVRISNLGEIDKMSNYFLGASNDTVSTEAKIVYNYANRNALYRQEDNKDCFWTEITITDAKTNIAENVIEGIEDNNVKVFSTGAFYEKLYPVGSREANEANNENTYIEKLVTMSKIITPEDSKDTLKYYSEMEIIERYNEAGRRSYTSVPGNYVPLIESVKIEPDTAINRKIIITKPFGGQDNSVYYLISASILGIVAIGVSCAKIRIKHKLKEKHK